MSYPATAPATAQSNEHTDASAKDKATAVGGEAQEQASALAETSQEQAAQVLGTAKEQASQVIGTATDQARNLLGEAQEELTSQATAQKDKAAFGLRALADDLAGMAEHSADNGIAGHLVSEASRRSGSLADYLEQHEPGHLLDDLRDLGRRRTGAFLLGAAVLGFAGGRLLKGSRSDAAPTTTPAEPEQVDEPADDLPQIDDEPSTLTGRYGSLAKTPSLMSPDDV